VSDWLLIVGIGSFVLGVVSTLTGKTYARISRPIYRAEEPSEVKNHTPPYVSNNQWPRRWEKPSSGLNPHRLDPMLTSSVGSY
jgi:hypothetical protein